MKLLFVFSIMLLAQMRLQAQDTIYKNDGLVIAAKVLEIGASVISYKKTSNPDGPTYTLYKSGVIKIVYANGTREVFNPPAPNPVSTETETTYYEENESKHFKRYTVMGEDFFQFYYRNISFFAEFIRSPVYAMRMSFYLNFNKNMDRPGFPLQHGISVYPHFFVYNNKHVHLFIGPHFYHGLSRNPITVVVDEYYDYNTNTYIPEYGEETIWNWHTLFLVEPGISINPIENLDITIHGGVGFVSTFGDLGLLENDRIQNSVKFAWTVGATIGGKW